MGVHVIPWSAHAHSCMKHFVAETKSKVVPKKKFARSGEAPCAPPANYNHHGKWNDFSTYVQQFPKHGRSSRCLRAPCNVKQCLIFLLQLWESSPRLHEKISICGRAGGAMALPIFHDGNDIHIALYFYERERLLLPVEKRAKLLVKSLPFVQTRQICLFRQ